MLYYIVAFDIFVYKLIVKQKSVKKNKLFSFLLLTYKRLSVILWLFKRAMGLLQKRRFQNEKRFDLAS